MSNPTAIASPACTVVWPALTYRDAAAAIRFLQCAFGFQERLVVPGESGRDVAHAELRWHGGGGVMLSSGVRVGRLGQPASGGAVYIVTDDPDPLYERARASGAAVVRGLRDDADYDSRGFTVRDPEGVIWTFGTYSGTC
jgi:uncharacterized glyoxalase superfamily protein PhnB